MRKLTILRRKSHVGCIMKDQVYIQDEETAELVIDGVPCRKLGDIKNGEEKSFLIDDAQRQVFLIVDKASKDYCNGSIVIPEGQEDVFFAGKHHFYFGSNPFRFDGVQLSDEQKAKQKKNDRKGLVICACAAIVGVIIGLFLPGGFLNSDVAEPKTFVKEDFKIVLTDDFEQTQEAGCFTAYGSKAVAVLVIRENAADFENMTLEEYGALILKTNNRADLELHKDGELVWCEYTDTPSNQELYYRVVCYQSEDAFWIVNFATPATNREKYKEIFTQWAGSVEVGKVAQ